METQTFINLPVKDLAVTRAFFTKLGFGFNEQFADENAICMIINQNTFVMLLVEKFFAGFTNKQVTDASKSTGVIIALSQESRARVDEMVKIALDAGGKTEIPSQDHGWMYQHGFSDPDGHMWEVIYSDLSQLPQ